MFNVEDHILIENLYEFNYRSKNSKFPDKDWTVNGLNYPLKKLRDTSTTAIQPGSGRRQSARTVENVNTVNDLVLSHKGALKNASNHVSNCKKDQAGIHHRQCTALFIRIFN